MSVNSVTLFHCFILRWCWICTSTCFFLTQCLLHSFMQLPPHELWADLVRPAVCEILGWSDTAPLKSSNLEGLLAAAFLLDGLCSIYGESNYFCTHGEADVTQVHFQWWYSPWKKIKSSFLNVNCAQVNGREHCPFFFKSSLARQCQATSCLSANPLRWTANEVFHGLEHSHTHTHRLALRHKGLDNLWTENISSASVSTLDVFFTSSSRRRLN